TWAMAATGLLFLAFITKSSAEHSRVITAIWLTLTAAFIVLWRVAARLVLIGLRRHGKDRQSVAIAGLTPMGLRVAERISSDPYSGMHVLGFYDDRKGPRSDTPEPTGDIVGDLGQLVSEARAGLVDRIYIALPLKAEPRIASIVHMLADTTATVFVVADFL